ncbi:DUF4113 domain-containing protein [Aeromonas hydrophila]|uniref:DUF4113 domain-containing protein n=1 Tax=Aeromonas hydrophila TaxID=644 RepID=UPI003C6F2BF1
MQVIDKINQGRLGKVYFAARGRDTREWMMKREQLSPPLYHRAQRTAGGEVNQLDALTTRGNHTSSWPIGEGILRRITEISGN